MSDNTKIGFIGFGNMAQAIADGLLSKNAAAAEKIFARAAYDVPAPQTGRSSAVIQKNAGLFHAGTQQKQR